MRASHAPPDETSAAGTAEATPDLEAAMESLGIVADRLIGRLDAAESALDRQIAELRRARYLAAS